MSVVESPQSRSRALTDRWLVWFAGFVALIVVAGIAFIAGRRAETPQTQSLRGDAYVGQHQVSVRVNGATYGAEGNVIWFDDAGTMHDGSWPTCLATVGSTVRVAFGGTTVQGPSGVRWYDVSWVDCRGARVIG